MECGQVILGYPYSESVIRGIDGHVVTTPFHVGATIRHDLFKHTGQGRSGALADLVILLWSSSG